MGKNLAAKENFPLTLFETDNKVILCFIIIIIY